jgi:hypothetical protein
VNRILGVRPETWNLFFTKFMALALCYDTMRSSGCARERVSVESQLRCTETRSGLSSPGVSSPGVSSPGVSGGVFRAWGASMKPRHPNLEWIKKVLADLESNRADPQIAALMGDLAETSSEPIRGVEPAQAPFGKSFSRPGR